MTEVSERQRRQRILTIVVILEVMFGGTVCITSIFIADKLSPLQSLAAFGVFAVIYALPLAFVSDWAEKAPKPEEG